MALDTPPQEGWVGQVDPSGEAGGERGGRRGRQNHKGSGRPREEGWSAKARKELLTFLGVGINMDRDGVMRGTDNVKFGGKRRFGKMVVGDKKGKEAEGEGIKGRQEGDATFGKGNMVSPWTTISTRGTFYGEYTSLYILC